MLVARKRPGRRIQFIEPAAFRADPEHAGLVFINAREQIQSFVLGQCPQWNRSEFVDFTALLDEVEEFLWFVKIARRKNQIAFFKIDAEIVLNPTALGDAGLRIKRVRFFVHRHVALCRPDRGGECAGQ